MNASEEWVLCEVLCCRVILASERAMERVVVRPFELFDGHEFRGFVAHLVSSFRMKVLLRELFSFSMNSLASLSVLNSSSLAVVWSESIALRQRTLNVTLVSPLKWTVTFLHSMSAARADTVVQFSANLFHVTSVLFLGDDLGSGLS